MEFTFKGRSLDDHDLLDRPTRASQYLDSLPDGMLIDTDDLCIGAKFPRGSIGTVQAALPQHNEVRGKHRLWGSARTIAELRRRSLIPAKKETRRHDR